MRDMEKLHRYVTRLHQLMEEEKALLQRQPAPGCAPINTAGCYIHTQECATRTLIHHYILPYQNIVHCASELLLDQPRKLMLLRADKLETAVQRSLARLVPLFMQR